MLEFSSSTIAVLFACDHLIHQQNGHRYYYSDDDYDDDYYDDYYYDDYYSSYYYDDYYYSYCD